MAIYVLKRLAQGLCLLLLVSFLVYGMIGLMPGDPIDLMLAANPHATVEEAARLKAIYGLDKPLFERYVGWLGAAIQGDFGYSRLYNQPTLAILWPRLINTCVLAGSALLLALIIAIPLGVYAAWRRNGWVDHAINLFCLSGVSVPPFWLALMLILVFSVILGLLPAGGMAAAGAATGTFDPLYMILPLASLTLATLAGYTRHVRNAMVDALSMEHIKTAMTKGATPLRVLFIHALPVAMLPVTTLIALDLGTLMGGAVITESLFSWPGMGRLIYDSILGNDYNVALISLLFVTIMILIGNLLADIGYTWLDPRIRLGADRT